MTASVVILTVLDWDRKRKYILSDLDDLIGADLGSYEGSDSDIDFDGSGLLLRRLLHFYK